jgi:hypothetical protein
MAQVRGQVWTMTTAGERPNGDLIVVSSLQLQDAIQYRVLGTPAGHSGARPAEPSLEDGYMWLMRKS